MSNEQRILEELLKLKREVNRFKRIEIPTGDGGGGSSGIWQDWTPASIVGWSSRTAQEFRYCLIGKTCFIAFRVTGTSNSATTSFTAPFSSKDVATAFIWNNAASGVNNSVALTAASRWSIDNNATTLFVYRTWEKVNNWTTSGTKTVQGVGFYEVA